jgi:hypothetical protein
MANHLTEGQKQLLFNMKADHAQRRREEQHSPYGQRPPRPPRRPRVPDPKPGTIAAVIFEITHCSPEWAAERAMFWAQEMFEPNDVRAWMEAGLGTDDLGLISDFRKAGVPPESMGWKIRNETILDRIRTHGYSSYDVMRTLRTAGLLGKKSA